MKKYLITFLTVLFAFAGATTLVEGYGRTITDPANGSALSSSVMRGLLQGLENEIQWATSTTGIYYGSSTSVGIGTTTPYAKLSVVGQIVGAYFTGTTTATSTFGGNLAISGTGTTTSAGGITLTGGCFYVNGSCIGNTTGATFPFDVNSWGNSTTSVLGFTNGFISNGSSTQVWSNIGSSTATTFAIPSITDSLLWTNANGVLAATTTGLVSAGSGISVTASRYVIGGALTITNDGVTSISATAPLVNNLSTGAISLTCPTCATFTYPFPSAATTTALSFANITFTNATGTAATTTNLYASSAVTVGNLSGYISGTTTRGMNIGSTTLDAMGKSFGAGTSTFLLMNDPQPFTLLGFYCKASTTLAVSGTAHVRIGDGVNFSEMSVCSTGGFTRTTTNNTFTSYEDFVIQASSTVGNVSRITITPSWYYTGL